MHGTGCGEGVQHSRAHSPNLHVFTNPQLSGPGPLGVYGDFSTQQDSLNHWLLGTDFKRQPLFQGQSAACAFTAGWVFQLQPLALIFPSLETDSFLFPSCTSGPVPCHSLNVILLVGAIWCLLLLCTQLSHAVTGLGLLCTTFGFFWDNQIINTFFKA